MGTPLISVPFVLLVVGAGLYFTAFGMLVPVLPLYVANDLSGGGLAVGVVVGVFSVSAAASRPFLGSLGDTRGRQVLVILGGVLFSVSVAGYAVASHLAPLLLLRLATGVGEAAMVIGITTAIQDLAPPDRRGEAVSYFSISLFGGLAVGPFLGEVLYRGSGPTMAWVVSALLATAGMLVAKRAFRAPVLRDVPVRQPRTDDTAGRRRRLLHHAALMPGVVLSFGMMGYVAFVAFVALYAVDLGLAGASGVFLLYGVVVLAVRVVGARIPDRLGPTVSSSAALAFLALGLGTMAVWGQPVGLYVGTFVFSVGHSLLYPALFLRVVGAVGSDERAHAIGTFTLFFDLAAGLGAFVLGGVAAVGGERGTFAVASMCCIVGFLIVWWTQGRLGLGRAASSPPAARDAS